MIPFSKILKIVTRQGQQQLVQKLSETELMVKAAERAHKAVQDLKAQADRIAAGKEHDHEDGSRPPSQRNEISKRMASLSESGVFSKLRDATAKIREDANADWQDIKNKFNK